MEAKDVSRKISWKLNKKTLIVVYNALIGSIIDYGFFILFHVSQTNIQKLQVIQNTCFKSIYHLPYDIPSTSTFWPSRGPKG
ncbi:hypothetical protein BpHYR1_036206 [Brachionus plicatilis]|uniref:Uncharacterized protein n=1 Tax=Brachionus plicatilis TaxID=10195 RepID=A0A3M7RK19_BRAPC|nr:hypothetical protein BpHYR1_036206 [Brachionus plicatilis]